MSFAHALKWSFASELAAKAIQPVVFIVLARLLTPEDFGVMTAAMMVIAFSQIFWEAGMSKALIQRQTDIEEAANAAFLINIALGIVIAALLYLFAQPIAQTFFQDDRVTAVLQVMTLQVLFGALGSVQTALLQKEMGFKKLFWVRFATATLPGLASIPLAWNGWGYWALVAGTLVGQFAQVLMLWRMSHWRPGLARDSGVTKEVAKFGGWVGATGLFAWFYAWADSLIVGFYLGTHDLGVYRLATQIISVLFAISISPALPVIYSRLVKKEISAQKKELSMVVQTITLLSATVGFTIIAGADFLENTVLGVQWSGIQNLLILMAMHNAIAHTYSANSEFYRAAKKPHFELFPVAIGVVFFLPAYLISIEYGLLIFTITRLILVMTIGTAIHVVLLKVTYQINHNWYLFVSIIYSLTMTAIAIMYMNNSDKNIVTLIAILAIGAISLIAGCAEGRQNLKNGLKYAYAKKNH